MAAPRLWGVRLNYSGASYFGQAVAGSALDWFGTNDMGGFRPVLAHLGFQVLSSGVQQPFSHISPWLSALWTASPRVLMTLDFGFWDLGASNNDFSLNYDAINAGNWDAYLTQFALDAKADGRPFLMRTFHEPNLSGQFPWQIGSQTWGTHTWTNTTSGYQQAFRRIIDIFHNNGCWNVTWIQNLNIQGSTGTSSTAYSSFYLGNDANGRPYPDWLSLDGYDNRISNGADLTWSKLMRGPAFGTTWLQDSYTHLAALHPTLPLMVSETETYGASAAAPTTLDRTYRANWYASTLNSPNKEVLTNTPRIYAISWFKWGYDQFHWNPDYDQLNAAASDVVAFKNGVSATGDWLQASAMTTPASGTPLQPYAVTAPVFAVTTPIGAAITNTTVTITWTTKNALNEPVPTTTWLKYGTTTAYGSTTPVINTSPYVSTHTVTVSGLTPGTTYHFQAQGTDSWGNVGTSGDVVVATTGADLYTSAETVIGAASLVLKLDDASVANAATAADSSGNALNGTYNGTTATQIAGIPGSSGLAWQTDGTDYIVVADNALLSPQVAGKLWLHFWFLINATPTGNVAFVCKGGAGANQWEYEAGLLSNGYRAIIYTLTGTTAISFNPTGVPPALGQWHMFDMAFDSTLANGTTDKFILYTDGARLGGATTLTGTLADGTSGLYVGRRGDGSNVAGAVGAPAAVDEIRLRNYMPTAAQIRQLWFAGNALRSRNQLLPGD